MKNQRITRPTANRTSAIHMNEAMLRETPGDGATSLTRKNESPAGGTGRETPPGYGSVLVGVGRGVPGGTVGRGDPCVGVGRT